MFKTVVVTNDFDICQYVKLKCFNYSFCDFEIILTMRHFKTNVLKSSHFIEELTAMVLAAAFLALSVDQCSRLLKLPVRFPLCCI